MFFVFALSDYLINIIDLSQEPQRVFTNNIVVRFHPGLEMDGDEIITIVCRYPPPVAPIPVAPPAPM